MRLCSHYEQGMKACSGTKHKHRRNQSTLRASAGLWTGWIDAVVSSEWRGRGVLIVRYVDSEGCYGVLLVVSVDSDEQIMKGELFCGYDFWYGIINTVACYLLARNLNWIKFWINLFEPNLL